MVIDKTEEEVGRGYQILAAIMPKTYSSKKNKVTFWEALTKGAKGFEKWFNVFVNGISIIAFFIITLSMLYCLVYLLYKLVHIFL